MSTVAKKKFPADIRSISLDRVQIPTDKYQRNPDEGDPRRLQRLIDGWEWGLYDPIKVYRVEDGYEVYDGGHRLRALQALGIKTAPASIYDVTDTEAAGIFADQDVCRRSVARYHKHKAALFNGDPLAHEIEDALQEAGFQFAERNRSSAGISAVGSIYGIVKDHGVEELTETLEFAKETWKHDEKITDGALLSGLAEFLHHYGEKVDDDARKRLSEVPIANILERASGHQQSTRKRRVATTLRELGKVRKRKSVGF